MAARRCSLCGIGYPDEWGFRKCLIHEEDTWLDNKSEPDPDWKQRAERIVANMRRDAEVTESIPTLEVRVIHADGQLWIDSRDVIRAGIRYRLEPDTLVRVGAQHFEIQAYSASRRAYLVEPFSMELTDDDLARFLDGS